MYPDCPAIIGFATGAKIGIGFELNKWRKFSLTKIIKWDSDSNPHMIEYYLQAPFFRRRSYDRIKLRDLKYI